MRLSWKNRGVVSYLFFMFVLLYKIIIKAKDAILHEGDYKKLPKYVNLSDLY
jgi:hypothetical protein